MIVSFVVHVSFISISLIPEWEFLEVGGGVMQHQARRLWFPACHDVHKLMITLNNDPLKQIELTCI